MPKLTEDQKLFIVQRLACYRTPTQVAEEVREQFGVEIPRQHVRDYNPLQQPMKVAKKYKEIFEATREQYKRDISAIPIANLSYRLEEIQWWYLQEREKKNPNRVHAKELLEQAAKDSGGVFTNRRILSGKVDISKLSDDELEKLASGEEV